VRLIQERENAAISPGLLREPLILLVLVVAGILWPLLALPAPENGEQVLFLLPWCILFLLFAWFMYQRADKALSELKNREPFKL
jgi:hypothetical protein